MSGDTLAHFLINRYVDARAMGGENVCVCVCVCVCVFTQISHIRKYTAV